uniref:Uncharacterized protein n=1 Tax=Wuchereria bancrofti TaxID=6293 RepID=A0AAF5PVD6_WUCBA
MEPELKTILECSSDLFSKGRKQHIQPLLIPMELQNPTDPSELIRIQPNYHLYNFKMQPRFEGRIGITDSEISKKKSVHKSIWYQQKNGMKQKLAMKIKLKICRTKIKSKEELTTKKIGHKERSIAKKIGHKERSIAKKIGHKERSIAKKIGHKERSIAKKIVSYDTIRCDTVRYDTVRYDTIRYDIISSSAKEIIMDWYYEKIHNKKNYIK